MTETFKSICTFDEQGQTVTFDYPKGFDVDKFIVASLATIHAIRNNMETVRKGLSTADQTTFMVKAGIILNSLQESHTTK